MPPFSPQSTRRNFLAGTAAGAALSLLAGQARAQAAAEPPLADYRPEFLSPAEYAFVTAATARLIPSQGEGPGAFEARVPVFIDRQLAGDFGTAADLYMEGPFNPDADPQLGPQSALPPAAIYQQAIAAFDIWCSATKGARFADLDTSAQDAALTALSAGEVALGSELREFWSLLLQNTKEGYFCDPQYGGNAGMKSWVYIGFPGARASYYNWVGRPETYPLGPVDIAGERA